jgi:hypothetical protein
MTTLTPLLAIIAIALCGCVRSIMTGPYQPNAMNNGVVYSLPTTRLKITITYTIEKRTETVNGIPKMPTNTITISKPVVIEPVFAADAKNSFVLSGEGLIKDARLDASFKFQVGENQLLTGATTDVTDKTPEVLQGLVGSGISVAKMAAMAGEDQRDALEKVGQRLKQINDKIAELSASDDDPKKLEKIDALQKEQAALLAFVAKYRELNTVKIEERDAVYTTTLGLAAFEWTGKYWENTLRPPGAQFGDFGDAAVPSAIVKVFATPDQYVNSKKQLVVGEPGERGVLYRSPTPLRTTVTAGPNNIVSFDDYVPFAQVGPFNKVEARYKVFAKRKTTIAFSPTTGNLKEYGIESTSSAEAAAKALDASLGKVQTATAEIKKAQEAAEAAKKTPEQTKLADLEAKKKLVEAEAQLIKAQEELDKLKAASPSK